MKRITYCPSCNGLGYINTNEDCRSWSRSCPDCQGKGVVEIPVTNYERVIQNMTPEKLAEIFSTIRCEYYTTCSDCPIHAFSQWTCDSGDCNFETTLRPEATE